MPKGARLVVALIIGYLTYMILGAIVTGGRGFDGAEAMLYAFLGTLAGLAAWLLTAPRSKTDK